MSTTASKMICPNCGVAMNHHCDKLVYATDLPEAGQIDPALGARVDEFHSCSKCGGVASRPA